MLLVPQHIVMNMNNVMKMINGIESKEKGLAHAKHASIPPRLCHSNEKGPNLDPKIVSKHLNPSI